jgi:uncharacterized repeat protein (TIGR03803 family)
MLAPKEFYMKSARLIPLCILLASQFALAQSVVVSDDPSTSRSPQSAISVRRSTHSHRHFTLEQQAQTSPEQVLYAFQGGSDGAYPTGNLIFDSAGNLYGVTGSGGVGGSGDCSPAYGGPGCGTVYELSPNGNGGWTKTTLYAFQSENDGAFPAAALIFDGAGNLYGTTYRGGTGTCQPDGCGTVFELSPNGSGGWTETVLYNFQGGAGPTADGASPWGLIFDKAGNLYGSTELGGNTGNNCSQGCGTVYELEPQAGGGWAEQILYRFCPQGGRCSDGSWPQAGLTFDESGNLYGSAAYGGNSTFQFGTIFELTPGGGGSWTETTLYEFKGDTVNPSDAATPNGGLIFDRSGNLYGTASGAGMFAYPGAVFELSPTGAGGWTESVPFTFAFPLNGNEGFLPYAGLVLDQSGNFYGTTASGGSNTCNEGNGCGLVFGLSPAGGGALSQTPLYAFQDGSSGAFPNSGLIFDQAGNLYGVAEGGGSGTGCNGYPCGVVYEVSIGPLVSFAPATAGFGDQAIGFASAPQGITLTNTGNKPMTISSIQVTGANASEFSQQNNCPAMLAASASCNISVTFLPTAVGGASASLTVTDNAQGSPQSVPLTGTGVIDVTFSPPSVTFPSQYVGTAGLPQAVTLTNNTNNAISINTVTASPGDFAAVSGCGTILQPGDHCTVGVFFDPTTSGTRNGVLTVTDTAPTGQQTVTLTGTGEDFAMVANSPSASVTPGEMAKYTVEVAPTGGFSQSVALLCTGAPVNASCSVSPSSVKLGGAEPVLVTISVSTAGGSAGMAYPAGFTRRNMLAIWLALVGLPGVVLVGRFRKKRVLLSAIALLCVIAGIMMWTACGGGGMGAGSSSTGGTTGNGPSTPAGSYDLTVVGTFSQGSANLVHSAKLTLIVQ